MRLALALATLAATTAFATPAVSAERDGKTDAPEHEGPPPSGPRLALRSGFALPIGQTFLASGAMSDTITGYVPIRFDLGYRVARHFYVGVAAQLADVVANTCPSGMTCSGSNLRFGVMLAYHLLPTRSIDPWLGIGMGFEQLSISRAVGDARVDVAARGIELLDVELGADLRPTSALRLGPVLSSSIGRFTNVTVNGTSTSDFEPTLHAWVMLGLRGAYDL
jgi:outer membrane protein